MIREQLKENRIHGDMMFPFGTYHMHCQSKNEILECHWHDEFEFLLVTDGCAVFQIGTTYYDVRKGQAILIPSGEIHAGFPCDHFHCDYSAAVFHLSLLASHSYDVIQSKYIEPLLKKECRLPDHIMGSNAWEKLVLRELKEIFDVAEEEQKAYEMIIKSKLYKIFSLLLPNAVSDADPKSQTTDSRKADGIKKVLEYIHLNYNRRIRIRELAGLLDMSEEHFCRFFKQMVRKTPVSYMHCYRVNRAARLLVDTRKKIIEVALDVGFDSLSYFISIFKRYMKCTPSQYRNRIKNKGK